MNAAESMPEPDPNAEVQPDVTSEVDENAWNIYCGTDGCSEELASCAWLDVQYYMILNTAADGAAKRAIERLPSPLYRTYRLCAEFPTGWKKDRDDVWRESRTSKRRVQRSGMWDLMALRVIHGRLNSASLNQEAEAPALAQCPKCEGINLIPRTHRVGVPGYLG
ncbi:MAG: hypothetical protein U5Q44_00010 [Dehalococcoidia bacterium]|nr:hypothetical protein [Dehalococcoidia bacterium]